MGGGDLNTKKAWHPSNLKNQERVWKAEQAVAAEKKRIVELERERAQERDREELNALSRQNPLASNAPHDNRLHWMYDKPDKQAQQEDYLLGRAIDKNYDQNDKPDQNEIPAVSRRVVGSSMITAGGDVQVDLVRKLREDPLLLVKERERAARAALLNNPIQRRRLAELLRKEQEHKNQNKKEKSKKSNLDDLLASKLSALSGETSMNLAKLLDSSSDSSSSDSSEEKKVKKKKKKKKMKKQKHKKQRDCSPDDSPVKTKKSKDKKKEKDKKSKNDDSASERYSKTGKSHNNYKFDDTKCTSPRKRKSTPDSDDEPHIKSRKNHREDSSHHHKQPERHDRYPKSYWESNSDRKKISRERDADHRYQFKDGRRETPKSGLSQEEKAARLAEMAAAGAEREVSRGKRVAEQLAEKASAEKVSNGRRSHRNEARILPDSLESRIHSNRHNIQRDKRHMNEHFARR